MHLTPLSFKEILYDKKIFSLNDIATVEHEAKTNIFFQEYLDYSGFPKAYTDKNSSILNAYYDDIITKDILTRYKRVNSKQIIELGNILAVESSRLFNRSSVARTIGIEKQETVSKYIQYFIATYLYKEIKAYAPSLRSQIRSLSKFYCVDHKMSSIVGFEKGVDDYVSLEQIVFNELNRLYKTIYYYKTKEDYEVDFLIVNQRKPEIAIQVSFDITEKKIRDREIRALLSSKKELGVKKLYIITRSQNEFIEEQKINVLSLNKFVLEGLNVM